MKTLLIVPPFPTRTYPGKTMAPDYLARALINNTSCSRGDIEILDLDVLSEDTLEKILLKENYGLIGISYLSFQTDNAMRVVERVNKTLLKKGLRNQNSKQYVPIIVGGHGTSQCDEVVPLFQEVDAWAIGEGLETIVEVFNSTEKGNFLNEREKIKGIKFYDKNIAKVKTTSKRILVENLEGFVPLRLHHYKEYDFDVFNNQKTAQVITSLGCKGNCVYCHESTSGRKVREKSLKTLEKEIMDLTREGYKAIYFDDSTFTWNKERTLKIISLMKNFHEKYGIVWGFNTRVDCLDREIIEKIKDSGSTYMFAGVESLATEVLSGINKLQGASPHYAQVESEEDYTEKARESYRLMKDVGLTTGCFLIFGGPTLTYKTVEGRKEKIRGLETLEQAKRNVKKSVWELGPDYISINILRFIPDAIISSAEKFSNLRGKKGKIHAGYFSRTWRKANNVEIEIFRNHPIYQAYEAAGRDYPIPPHMNPKHCYSILDYLVQQVNLKTIETGKQTQIVVDKTFERYLQKDDEGIYHLTSFEELSEYQSKIDLIKQKVKSMIKPAVALTASLLAGLIGNWDSQQQNNFHDQYLKLMRPVLERFSQDSLNYDSIRMYVMGNKKNMKLEDLSRILTLYCMQSDGESYKRESHNPETMKDYEAFIQFNKKL